MGISFFDSVLPSFRVVGVSKRRTQAGTLVLRLMGRCVGLKRPCTGPCLEGRAKKDIPMLGLKPISKSQSVTAFSVLEPLEVGLDKYVDITIHHPFNISDLKIGPVVLHELVRVECV